MITTNNNPKVYGSEEYKNEMLVLICVVRNLGELIEIVFRWLR